MSYLVVLVRTHNPGNLGSAARAAKAFGAGLTLVDPRADRAHADALAFASGAEDVLAAAPIVRTLDDVEADLLVALTSLRGRRTRGLPPATTWAALRRSGRAALVIGPERSGLTADELRRCHARTSLPTRPEFPTLNLAQAATAALALLSVSRERPARVSGAKGPALDRLLTSFRDTLKEAGYPGSGHSPEVLHELTSLLLRARPTEREATLFLGALAALRRALKLRGESL